MSKGWKVAVLLAILHVILAMMFAQVTPFLTAGRVLTQGGGPKGIDSVDIGAPDELRHVVLAARLANGAGYPKLDKADPRLDFNYQAHQPPLFYALLAGWMNVTKTNQTKTFVKDLETQSVGDTVEQLHSSDWSKYDAKTTIQAEGLKLRLLNALIGAAGVLGAFAVGFWATGKASVGVGSALFAALLPMNIALSGALSNDPLLITLISWTLAILALGTRIPLKLVHGIALGLIVALALLTKMTALALLPLLILGLIFARRSGTVAPIGLALGLALLVGGAWWMRNMQVYGEPFLQRTFHDVFAPRSPLASDMIARVGPGPYWSTVAQLTGYSTLGVFGYMDIYLPDTLYSLTWILYISICIGSVVAWVRFKSKVLPPTVLAGALFVIVLVLYVQFNLQFFQAQGRYLLPALAPLALAFGAGLAHWFGKRSKYALIGVFIYFVFLDMLAWTILPPSFEVRTAPVADLASSQSQLR